MIPPLPLASRTFLFSFLMISVALLASFLAVSAAIKRQVREELRNTLRQQEAALEEHRAEAGRHVARLASVLSESVGLKVGLGLLRESPASQDRQRVAQLRRTVEQQLRDLGQQLGYDLLIVADAEEKPVAALVSRQGVVEAVDSSLLRPQAAGLLRMDETLYEVIQVPINMGDETLGSLTLGKKMDLGAFREEDGVALLRDSRVLATTIAPAAARQLEKELDANCDGSLKRCEITLGSETFLVMPMRRASAPDGYSLVSLRSLDAATRAFTGGFWAVFLVIGAGSLVTALVCSALVSRSIAGPLQNLVDRLTQSEKTGELPNDFGTASPTKEVNQLAHSFNRAADAIGESRRSLERAYLEFIETMASALDARDPYTAGHSDRVGRYAVAVAKACGCTPAEIETIRVGARLHDIGKIGVPDAVLQKPGKLTKEEFDLIKQHPTIGRRILERVGRFHSILPIVELHHEDWDGSGYPFGLSGEEVPLSARIVHVADVYDALSSDRSYRQRMSDDKVRAILTYGRGRQFDPHVVDEFFKVLAADLASEQDMPRSLLSLVAPTGLREVRVDEEARVEIVKSA